MDPLATVADLEARGVTVDPAEEAVTQTFLDVASAVVRDAAGSPISEATTTTTLEGSGDAWLRLPGSPVTAVAAVSVDGSAVTDWRLSAGALWRGCGWGDVVDVTYTHGLPAVPADIADLVCRMAAQALVRYRESPAEGIAGKPVVQERIGDYSVTYGYEVTFSDMELPKYLRARLRARFGGGAAGVKAR